MSNLSYHSIEGRHTVHKKYLYTQFEGVTYLRCGKDTLPASYDPLRDYDDLLLDVMAVAEVVLACPDFWAFCVKHGGDRIADTVFWRGEDFFGKNSLDAKKIMQALFNFTIKYGLPEWETGRRLEVELPDRYIHLLITREKQETNEDNVAYAESKKQMAGKEILPAGTMALMMVDFYDRFLLQRGNTYLYLERATTSFQHSKDREPELMMKVHGLVSCIDWAYVLLVSGRKSAVRQCKQCKKIFIAEDLRAEYCSGKCRGAYNSAMTRKRKKVQG